MHFVKRKAQCWERSACYSIRKVVPVRGKHFMGFLHFSHVRKYVATATCLPCKKTKQSVQWTDQSFHSFHQPPNNDSIPVNHYALWQEIVRHITCIKRKPVIVTL